jgi:hypothetical protein
VLLLGRACSDSLSAPHNLRFSGVGLVAPFLGWLPCWQWGPRSPQDCLGPPSVASGLQEGMFHKTREAGLRGSEAQLKASQVKKSQSPIWLKGKERGCHRVMGSCVEELVAIFKLLHLKLLLGYLFIFS